jgi:hypothetical protein
MTKLALLVVLPLALLALGGIVVVDVREGGPDGCRSVVPVPLLLARIVVPFLPEDVQTVECPLEPNELAAARGVVAELRRQPDFTLVEVLEGDERILVRKQGRCLVVDVVDGPDEEVHCRLPIKAAERVLERWAEGNLRASAAVRACTDLPHGDVVHVRDGDDVVRIWRL